MIKTIFLTGLLLCAGSGLAAYKQYNPGTTTAGMSHAAMNYMAGAPARLKNLLSARQPESPEVVRPRIARLPQASGVNNRGNTSLAERRMRATARSMVAASPTARAVRDTGRDSSHQRRWSKLMRKAPDEATQGGRLNAVQIRAREQAAEEADFQKMLKANGYTGPNMTLREFRAMK
ncbi:MAG: hypothetical protein AB8B60_12510 [Sulfitobacter sp.]